MGITLTEGAAKQVLKTLSEHGTEQGSMLRIGVQGGGCSGLNYALHFESEFDEKNDNVSDQHGVKVVVDKKSNLFLDGTVLDYYEGIDNQGFQFHNPNAVKTCGCGSSFQA
jgi:iron-sulfur cluster assembly protein